MRHIPSSTIAQILYTRPVRLEFDRLVEELDDALPEAVLLEALPGSGLAIFRLDGSTVLLSLARRPGGGHEACLSASVSPAAEPGMAEAAITQRGAAMCGMIVERIQDRHAPDAVAWHKLPGMVTPERLEALLAEVPTVQELAPLSKAQTCLPPLAPVNKAEPPPEPAVAKAVTGNEPLRAALYPDGPPWQAAAAPANVNAVPMRLAIHTMNTTLILVSLPVGAAMLTYSLLRGEDLRMTSRALVLTGLGMIVMESRFGQALLALI